MAPDNDAKRANTVLTIAQLRFKQALKKNDHDARLDPIPVELSSHFFQCLDALLWQNTPTNVQKCTEWIFKYIAPSRARIEVLGHYLVSVSKSIVVDRQAQALAFAKKSMRNRFDLLLLVNDVLHSDQYHHHHGNSKQGSFSSGFAPFTLELIELAASVMTEKNSSAEDKLKGLLNFWAINRLADVENLASFGSRAEESLLLAQGDIPIRKRTYLLPEYHGDKTAPWHDLPASYMLDQMIKNPKKPIDSSRIKVVKLEKKLVSPRIRKLLDDYFENIDLKYLPTGNNPSGETKKYNMSLDALGQLVKQNKETTKTAIVCNGYGWSAKFCQDMRKHGVSENIAMLRDKLEYLEVYEDGKEAMRKQRLSRSPRQRHQTSSESECRRDRSRHDRSRHDRSRSRGYDRSRRFSGSSNKSLHSRSRSHDRSHGRKRYSERDRRRDASDEHQKAEEKGSHLPHSRPKPSDQDLPWSTSNWNHLLETTHHTISKNVGSHQVSAPHQSHQDFGLDSPQVAPTPFNALSFPSSYFPPKQSLPPFSVGQSLSHPPFLPQQFSAQSDFLNTFVPPPILQESHQSSAFSMHNKSSSHHDSGNQPFNRIGQGGSSGLGHSSRGFQESRSGYGSNIQCNGYESSRGTNSGSCRGQRGGRF